jgi:2-dehydropantoate 2-reductase
VRAATYPLKILCFGAGAIGTYVGGSLALAGHTLMFVERAETAAELKANGLHLDFGAKLESLVSSLTASETLSFASSLPEALERGPFDAALLAIKSYDTASALEDMKPYADSIPPILCLQNGVDNEPAIAAALGVDKVIYGTVTTAIGRRGTGDIFVERLRGIGVADGHPLTRPLVEALTNAHLNARRYPHPADMKWSKMLTNLLCNASSAILDMSPAEILANPNLFQVEMRMLREALSVMGAQGIHVVNLPGTPVRALGWGARLPGALARPLMARAVAGGRGAKMPSFHIDLRSRRSRPKESEVDYLNGAVVRAGERAGVATPVNKFLTETLLALTHGDMPLDTFAHSPVKFRSMLAP